MQVTPPDAANSIAALFNSASVARVVAGNLTAVPIGVLVQASVTQAGPRETTLNVNGQALTLRPGPGGFPPGLQQGSVLVVRVPNSSPNNQTLELVGQVANPAVGANGGAATAQTNTTLLSASLATLNPTAPASTAATSTIQAGVTSQSPVRVAMVDVLAVLPDGRVRVQLDGDEVTASAENLTAGTRAIVQVERTPTGLALRPAVDSPNLPTVAASAVLRGSDTADLAASLKPLLAELATLQSGGQSQGTDQSSAAVRDAAAAVGEAIRNFLPPDARPLNSAELQSLVEDGGLHFEAKLARLVAGEGETANPAAGAPGTATQSTRESIGPDLKGDLLRLLQTVQDLGEATQAPAARATLNGIEAQQATNTLANAERTPYVIQVPFPDGGQWRTLHLAVESEGRGRQSSDDDPGSFRMLMHVPLTDLGDTWIDAGLSGNRFRAVMYLSQADTRDRVRTELPGLQRELVAGGFDEVLLDVRPTGDLPAARRRQGAAMQAGRPDSVSILDVKA